MRTWSYNAGGRLLTTTQPESGTTTHQYDTAGRLWRTTDALGRVTELGYDDIDRLLTRDAANASADIALEYDAVGRIKRQTIGSLTVGATGADIVTTTFTFDDAARPKSRADAVSSGQTFLSQYGYDTHDNLTSITYPSGRVVGYTYDTTKEDRLIGVTNNGAPFASGFHYDARGRLDRFYTGPVEHAVSFDSRSRVSGISAGQSGLPQLALTYGYNNLSQVISMTDSRPGMNQAFWYDALDRLKIADGPWGHLEWSYDPQGNRLTEQRAGATTVYNYQAATQRLTSTTTGTTSEPFSYSGVGELTSDGQGTYTYSPAGMMLTATRANLSAAYLYDADHLRVRRDVNGVSQFTVRSVGGQVLAEYQQVGAGTMAWVRDNIYAGSRLLGAVKNAALTMPKVELTSAAPAVTEGGGVTIMVRLTTPNQQPITTPVTATVRTVVPGGGGAAQPAFDYTAITQTVTFPASSAHGATLSVVVPTVQDPIDEPNELVGIELTAGPGALLATLSAATLTIADDDAPPTVSINSPAAVLETAGSISLMVSLSAPSAFETRVSYASANHTAVACTGADPDNAHTCDYTAVSGQLVLGPGVTEKAIVVPIVDNGFAEPTQSFTVALSAPVNLTLGAATGTVTITDNEVRAPIDLSKGGQHYADVVSTSDEASTLNLVNLHPQPATARVTYTWPNGTGFWRDYVIPASGLRHVHLNGEPNVAGGGMLSVSVQPADPALPGILSEVETYASPSTLQSGRTITSFAPASGLVHARRRGERLLRRVPDDLQPRERGRRSHDLDPAPDRS